MKPKTINILYWTFTVLFSLLMLFASVGGLQPTPDTIKVMHDGMGFPVYFIQFISIAKVLGVIAILIPNLRKGVKEWAYAGLFFDLSGAVYSCFASAPKFDPLMLTLILWIVPGILSYYYWKKISHLRLSSPHSRTQPAPAPAL
ncbi:DoxX family protein [Puia sp. P3]|uniref:DoxX family protein n=1 Tax=Puia sp. P3 TaxID=3423952 RepID=UPI003D66F023